MKYILILLLCCSCAGVHSNRGGFFGNTAAHDAGVNAANAANVGNPAATHIHHHTPPPMPMAAPGF